MKNVNRIKKLWSAAIALTILLGISCTTISIAGGKTSSMTRQQPAAPRTATTDRPLPQTLTMREKFLRQIERFKAFVRRTFARKRTAQRPVKGILKKSPEAKREDKTVLMREEPEVQEFESPVPHKSKGGSTSYGKRSSRQLSEEEVETIVKARTERQRKKSAQRTQPARTDQSLLD